MICKKCRADIGNKGKCEYCDTVYFEAFQQQNAQPGKKKTTKQESRKKDKSGKTKARITFPTKVAMVFWFMCCMANLPEIESIGYSQYMWVAILGFLFFGGITQLISSALKRQNISDHSEQTAQSQIRNADLSSKSYDHMDIPEFELFCCDILEKNGLAGISITKTPEDQGIDIIAFKNGTRYGIRCKCGTSIIGIATIQKVLAGKNILNAKLRQL